MDLAASAAPALSFFEKREPEIGRAVSVDAPAASHAARERSIADRQRCINPTGPHRLR